MSLNKPIVRDEHHSFLCFNGLPFVSSKRLIIMEVKEDISTRKDIELMVNSFYEKVQKKMLI